MQRPESADRNLDPASHDAWVRSLARALVHDDSVAEDVAQEALLALATRPPARRFPVRAWLRGVVRHKIASHWRGTARRAVREERAAARTSLAPDTASEVARAEALRAVADAVAGLDEPYRTTVRMVHFQGLSVAEVARRLDVPYQTANARLRRGLERLRGQLDRRFGDRATWALLLAPDAASDAPRPGSSPGRRDRTALRVGSAALVVGALVVVGTLAGRSGAVPPPVGERHTAAIDPDDRTPTTRAAVPRGDRTERRVRTTATRTGTTPSEAAPTATSDRTAETRIAGVLRHPDGAPLRGAQVTRLLYDAEDRQHRHAETVRATPSGTFSLGPLAEDEIQDVVLLEVGAEGVIRTSYRVNAHEIDAIELTLHRSKVLAGRLLEADGEPAAGVRVSAWHGTLNESSAVTGASGRFALEWPVARTLPYVVVTRDGMRPQKLSVDTGKKEAQREIGDLRLRAFASFRGRVLGPDGKPRAGAEVYSFTRQATPHKSGYAVTDDQGRFELASIPVEDHDVEVWWLDASRGDGRWLGRRVRGVRPGGGAIELRCARVYVVRLVLTERETGASVSHKKLWVAVVPPGADRLDPARLCRFLVGETVLALDVQGTFDLLIGSADHRPTRVRDVVVGTRHEIEIPVQLAAKEGR